jgi:hypothetical protein
VRRVKQKGCDAGVTLGWGKECSNITCLPQQAPFLGLTLSLVWFSSHVNSRIKSTAFQQSRAVHLRSSPESLKSITSRSITVGKLSFGKASSCPPPKNF